MSAACADLMKAVQLQTAITQVQSAEVMMSAACADIITAQSKTAIAQVESAEVIMSAACADIISGAQSKTAILTVIITTEMLLAPLKAAQLQMSRAKQPMRLKKVKCAIFSKEDRKMIVKAKKLQRYGVRLLVLIKHLFSQVTVQRLFIEKLQAVQHTATLSLK